MHIKIVIDLSNYLNQTLNFCLNYDTDDAPNELTLPALKVKQGAVVKDLSVIDNNGQAVSFTVMGDVLSIDGHTFRITYSLQTNFTQCVGSDKELELLYPFLNSNEIFFGSGAIAYPAHLNSLAENIQATFRLTNLPAGWQTFSNLTSETISPATLDSFFAYCASAQNIDEHIFSGLEGQIAFQLCVQYGKTIPIAPKDIWSYLDTYCHWLEHHLLPLRQVQQVNILILQAPADFEDIANHHTFATGENMLNGISTYGPVDTGYLQRMFNYSSYAYFLYDGLTHELMHYYTTTSWQGRYKSVLYPASDCPPEQARLMGEGLNIYFHDQYVRRCFSGSDEQFMTETLSRALPDQHQEHRQSPLLGLFLLDIYLCSLDSSLLKLFGRMIVRQQAKGEPYHSMVILFDVLQEELGITLPAEYREILLGTRTADIPMIEFALRQIGYDLKATDDKYRIEKRSQVSSTFVMG